MAIPATITIRHSSTGSALKVLEYTPQAHSLPDNVSGKTCILQCQAFSFDPSVAATGTGYTFILTLRWTMPLARVYSDTNVAIGQTVIGMCVNDNFYSGGPVVVNVPEGPAEMTFVLSRTDGGDLCGASSTNVIFAAMTITPVE